jgi:hypothetical protein
MAHPILGACHKTVLLRNILSSSSFHRSSLPSKASSRVNWSSVRCDRCLNSRTQSGRRLRLIRMILSMPKRGEVEAVVPRAFVNTGSRYDKLCVINVVSKSKIGLYN